MDPAGDSGGPWHEPGREDEALAAHPDLRDLGRKLRMEMDETLRAEQYAARVSARRRSTLRDRFLLAEDRAERVSVGTVSGGTVSGVVAGVGADHVLLADGPMRCCLSIQHVVSVISTGS